MNTYIKMHVQYNIYIHHCAITLKIQCELNYHHWERGTLTVDRDLDFALIGRSHSIVGDAFVVLGLLPLDLCDVKELPFTHQPIY